MFEYPFVEWNLYKLTSTGRGSLHSIRKDATLGTRWWKEYPCYFLLFRFSNLTGRILSFGRSSDFYPHGGTPYNPRYPCMIGALIVAHDWVETRKHHKKKFTDSPLYLLVDKELPEKASLRATLTLDKTIEMYNNEYGFTPRHADYDGFSEGLEKTG